MRARRGFAVGVLVTTGLLLAATAGLASLPPRPLRSALTVLHTLTFRVATDWLAVVALLAVGGRAVRRDASVGRVTVAALTVGVFLGGVVVEASPLVRFVVASPPVDTGVLVEGIVVAVQRALYPTGLFLAVVVGATIHERRSRTSHHTIRRFLPLAPSSGWVPNVYAGAVVRVVGVFAAVSAVSLAIDLGTRLAVGVRYPWLVAVDAGVGAVGAGVGYAVLAGAFLVLAVEGVTLRSLTGTTAALWVTLGVAGVLGGVATAGFGVALVGLAGTPMPAVEAARLGRWPAPHSWATLLRLGTLLAGGVGLLAVQRTAATPSPTGRDVPVERPGGTDIGTGGGAGAGNSDHAGANTGDRR